MVHESKIVKFFSDKNILITGSTGFFGKLLLEKLLRCCPDLSMVYLLIEDSHANSAEDKLQKILSDPLFNKLKTEYPNFESKIKILHGNVIFENIGLSTEHYKEVIEKINIIFHADETLTFNDTLPNAVTVNVKGTEEILAVCEKMKRLQCFMFVSSLFTFHPCNALKELYYDPPMKPDLAMKMVKEMDREILENITKEVLFLWPNTYTFTKVIAEDLCKSRLEKFPIGLFRPALTLSTYQDPIPGWVDETKGPISSSVGFATGFTKITKCNPKFKLFAVPADYAVNNLLAATIDTIQKWEIKDYYSAIYHCSVNNNENPITIGDYNKMTKRVVKPGSNCAPGTTCPFMFYLFTLLFHFIPALVKDFFLMLQQGNTMYLKRYKELYRRSLESFDFLNKEWNVQDEINQSLWRALTETDKKMFPFDMKSINWEEYCKSTGEGLRKYYIKVQEDEFYKKKDDQHYTLEK